MAADLRFQPEPCLAETCRAPMACREWGYCRQRNIEDRGPLTAEKVAERRREAEQRREIAIAKGA